MLPAKGFHLIGEGLERIASLETVQVAPVAVLRTWTDGIPAPSASVTFPLKAAAHVLGGHRGARQKARGEDPDRDSTPESASRASFSSLVS